MSRGGHLSPQDLEDIGFLDPEFFLIYEDVDLSFRAQLSGYECVCIPKAIVYHRYRVMIG
jgi:GT2 family glycosyltransferase